MIEFDEFVTMIVGEQQLNAGRCMIPRRTSCSHLLCCRAFAKSGVRTHAVRYNAPTGSHTRWHARGVLTKRSRPREPDPVENKTAVAAKGHPGQHSPASPGLPLPGCGGAREQVARGNALLS